MAGALPPLATGGTESEDVSGTLAEPSMVAVTCSFCTDQVTPGVRVSIAAADGGVWALQATPAANVSAWIPALHEAAGEIVSLSVRFRRVFQDPASIGFVVSDSDGAIIAADAGPHLNVDISVPGGLNTKQGEPFCGQSLTCAGGVPGTEDMMVFTSSTTVAVGPAADGQLTIGRPTVPGPQPEPRRHPRAVPGRPDDRRLRGERPGRGRRVLDDRSPAADPGALTPHRRRRLA